MKRWITAGIIISFIGMVAYAGCGVKKADSSREAITNAKTMGSAEKQADYLVKQANAFYKAKEYKDAINTAHYVIRNLDKKSSKAREILEKAKRDMAQAAQERLKNIRK